MHFIIESYISADVYRDNIEGTTCPLLSLTFFVTDMCTCISVYGIIHGMNKFQIILETSQTFTKIKIINFPVLYQ